jgi:hypothetical protein
VINNIILIEENLSAIWEGNPDKWNVLGDLSCVYKGSTKVKELPPFSRVLGTSYLASFLID